MRIFFQYQVVREILPRAGLRPWITFREQLRRWTEIPIFMVPYGVIRVWIIPIEST